MIPRYLIILRELFSRIEVDRKAWKNVKSNIGKKSWIYLGAIIESLKLHNINKSASVKIYFLYYTLNLQVN